MSPPADLRARVLDAALASASGLALWWLCDRHGLADRMLPSGYIAADFVDYCRGLLWMDGADVRWPERRYPAAALPAWMLTHGGGLVEGLRDAASLCTMLLGTALYLWARVAHGRLAGLLAIACACTMAPLVLLPRMLSFYPAMVAGTAFGAAAAMVGLTGPGGRRIGWVGLGAGLVLLLDGRGIVWAAPWLLCGVLAVLLTPGPRARRLAWLLAPVLGSWFVAGALDPGGLLSFEAQVDVRPLYHAAGSTNPAHGPPWADGGAFVWGRSMPWALVDTAGFLFQQLSLEPPAGGMPRSGASARQPASDRCTARSWSASSWRSPGCSSPAGDDTPWPSPSRRAPTRSPCSCRASRPSCSPACSQDPCRGHAC